MSEPEREKHKARNWVEGHFPDWEGSSRVALIVAYGAGLDAGLAEAQTIIASHLAKPGTCPLCGRSPTMDA